LNTNKKNADDFNLIYLPEEIAKKEKMLKNFDAQIEKERQIMINVPSILNNEKNKIKIVTYYFLQFMESDIWFEAYLIHNACYFMFIRIDFIAKIYILKEEAKSDQIFDPLCIFFIYASS
jgi:hypothetical protein